MKIKKLIPTLTTAYSNPNKRMNVLLVGAPGIGKTEVIKALSKELGRLIIIKHPVVESPVDGKGLPVSGQIDGELTADFIPYGDMKKMMNTKEPLLVFIDDLGQAAPSVQGVYMQLIQERSINGKKIADQVQFIAATNDKTHNAGVVGLITSLLSRFNMILNIEADAESWIEWALRNDIDSSLISFIQMNPQYISTFDPKNKGLVNFACPRTLENLSGLLQMGLDDSEVINGSVGEKMGVTFKAFYDMKDTIIRYLKDIESNPTTAIIPTKADQLYFLVNILANKCKAGEDYFENIMGFINRLPSEYQPCFMKSISIKYPDLQKTAIFGAWNVRNQNFTV